MASDRQDSQGAPAAAVDQPGGLGTGSQDEPGSPGEADTVVEPTIKVPVPAPGWIVIVAGTANRASAAELPRAAFRDPALNRLLAVLDSEMTKDAE